MSEQDKQPHARQDKKIPTIGIHSEEKKKFEIQFQPWTPYGRPGSWLQFIWRF